MCIKRQGEQGDNEFADAIEVELRAHGNAERAVQEKRYLKSDLEFIGTGVPAMRTVAKTFARDHRDLDRAALIALVEALWEAPVHERRLIAIELLALYSALLDSAAVTLVERLLRDSRTWAFVDDLSVNVAAPLVERYPELSATLDRWSSDGDFWLRRASMLALLPALRRGGGDFDRFARYAGAMLEEKEFFVRKAIGWILRETGKKRPELVVEWLGPRARRASGVTMREAVKYLPPAERDALLAEYRKGRPAYLY